MELPTTQYARTTEGYVAYQLVGSGSTDIVLVTEAFQNIEAMWDQPLIASCLHRLASLGRLIFYDKRGCGISDVAPRGSPPSLEHGIDDTLTVLDAAGSRRAVLFGEGNAGPIAIMFAATYPERTRALILLNSYARFLRDADYPWGLPTDRVPRLLGAYERAFGTGDTAFLLAPSLAHDETFRSRWARYERMCNSPSRAVEMFGAYLIRTDVRAALGAIGVPTLVLHRADDYHVRVGHGRYLGQNIPGAIYRELPGDAHPYYAGDHEELLAEIREFLTGVRDVPDSDRMLATVMFTDIVGSTQRAAQLGDRQWRQVRDAHDALVRGQLARFRGREIDTTGDGFLAMFDGPARAIRCAREIADGVSELGMEIRAGLHTGECERMGDDVSGIAIHIAQRVLSLAGPTEVLVSSTVKDLVVGSGIEFEERGSHQLKGVPGEWQVHAVTGVA